MTLSASRWSVSVHHTILPTIHCPITMGGRVFLRGSGTPHLTSYLFFGDYASCDFGERSRVPASQRKQLFFNPVARFKLPGLPAPWSHCGRCCWQLAASASDALPLLRPNTRDSITNCLQTVWLALRGDARDQWSEGPQQLQTWQLLHFVTAVRIRAYQSHTAHPSARNQHSHTWCSVATIEAMGVSFTGRHHPFGVPLVPTV